MKVITLIIVLAILALVSYAGYNYFFKKTENYLDIDSKIPVYHYKFELPKQPEITPLELSSVDPLAVQAQSVQFKRTDSSGYLKNMYTFRQENKGQNCNSIVGISQRPISSGNPQIFTEF